MRSSKSRSRSKQNRPRSLGNIINRVFDSSGPEGKVRGTPQQIIEKYQVLARDAQLSNDRVAAENFLQHAEHYTRMLAEAQREMAAEQEARQQQYQQNGNGGGNQNGNRDGRDNRDNRDNRDGRDGRDNRWRDDRNQDPGAGEQPDISGMTGPSEEGSSMLVETPEARVPEAPSENRRRDDRPRRDDQGGKGRDRRDRGPKPERAPEVEEAPQEVVAVEAPALDADQPVQEPLAEAKPKRARSPKKPKASADGDGESPSEAAE